jgi:hypothetical protein
MSIIDQALKLNIDDKGNPLDPISLYKPSAKCLEMRALIVGSFQQGDVTMRKPRREFNDLSVLSRMAVDQMAYNTYQANDGDALEGDETTAWKSNAMKPIVRNKIISIAAHATARTIFPKIFAYSQNNEEQKDAAQVMRDLMEWTGDRCNYSETSFHAVISALINPASIVYTDYVESYKPIRQEEKDEEDNRKIEYVLDEEESGFQDVVVPVDELYIENIYEHDIQKQQWLIWRRVQSYGLLKSKYNKYENFKYVKPGIQLIYNNANQTFYEIYDMNMHQEMGEEIIFWNKQLDLKLIMVNGVLLTDHDNPNPRLDKRYPFAKFGYELIDEGRFFYYKSLAFKMKQDANIINTLYPMIIDGTYLNIFSPVAISGSEMIDSDVIIPGAAITFSDKDTKINPLRLAQDIGTGMNTLMEVEKSINESSQEPLMAGQNNPGSQTAYEISKIEQNANTVLGLFIKMIATFVKSYGKLKLSDILQHITIAEAADIEGNKPLVYKTFLLPERTTSGKTQTRKIEFDGSMPEEPMSGEDQMIQSYEVLKQGKKQNIELYKVNPAIFRSLKYHLSVTPDVLQPTSEELERAYLLEEYDRAINNPLIDQMEVTKDFLLGAYPKSKGNVDKYISKQPQVPQQETGQNPMDILQTLKGSNLSTNLNKSL